MASPSKRSVTATGLSYTASLKCGTKITAALAITADVTPLFTTGLPAAGPVNNYDIFTAKSPVTFTVSGTFTPSGNTGLPIPTKVVILPITAGNKLCPDVSGSPKATMNCPLTSMGRSSAIPGAATVFAPFEVTCGADGFTYTVDLAPGFAESSPSPDLISISNVIPVGDSLAPGLVKFGGTATATLNSSFVGYASVELSDASGKLLGRSDTDPGNTRTIPYGNSVTANLSTPYVPIPTSGSIYLRAVLRTPISNTPTYSAPITYVVAVNSDLAVTGLHLVQAVQTPNENVTLIGGKKTVARVFVNSIGQTAQAVSGVSALLRCDAPDGVTYFSGAGTRTVVAKTLLIAPPAGTAPDLSADSVDIVVPEACTVPHNSGLRVEAEVIPPPGVTDPNNANDIMRRSYTFATPPGSGPFKIGWFRLGLQPPGVADPQYASVASVTNADALLRRIYPVPESGVSYFPLTLALPVYKLPVNTVDLLVNLVNYVGATLLLTDLPENEVYDQAAIWTPGGYYPAAGISDPKWGGGTGRVAMIAESDPYPQMSSFTHEVGHNMGLRHTNVAAPTLGCPNVAPDNDTAWPFPDATIQTYGYLTEVMRKLTPTGYFDLMSYCPKNSRWISPYSFEALIRGDLKPLSGLPIAVEFADLPKKAPEQRAAGPQDLWLIRGSAMADGTSGTLEPFVRVTSSHEPATNNSSGSHCLLFKAADGSTLSSFCFSLPFRDSENNPLSRQPFSFLIPVVPNAATVSLAVGTNELISMAGAAGALQLAITSPQAGDRWSGGGSRTVSWSFSGGAPATFAVQYSSDGGTSWLPLGAGLTDTSLTFDTSQLMGSDKMRFRVLAGVGMSTASAEVGSVTLVQTPHLQVAGATIDMHSAVVNQSIDHPVRITNTGNGPLRITAIAASGSQFRIVSPMVPAIVMAGNPLDMIVRFLPATAVDVTGTLRVDSNDPTQPSLTIPIKGKGIVAPTSEITVTPASLDFGSVPVGQGQTRTLTVGNFGPAPLNVTSIGATANCAVAVGSLTPFTVDVDQTVAVPVRFSSTATGPATCSFTISSDDPAHASTVVNATATGTPAGNALVPTITAGGVVNAASFQAGLARGGLATIFGTNLADSTQLVSATTWPTLVAGAKVLIAGVEAPLYFVSAGQINFQTPLEVPLGPVQVVVVRDGIEGPPQTATVAASAPGVFTYARTSTAIDPIVIHLDGQLVSPANPAVAGEYLVAFLTGIGTLTNNPQTGRTTPLFDVPETTSKPVVTLGGAPVSALFTGLTPGFIGLAQMNIQLPATLPAGTSLTLKIQLGAGATQDVQLAVK